MTELKEYQEVFGMQATRKEILQQINSNQEVTDIFTSFNEELQDEFISFCMGNRGLKITYDPFFKFIFNPALHPERLSEVLSLLIGEKVEIVDILPNESDRIHEKGSLLIMDILVRLRSGAYANVEIQRVGYAFPGQRCACYSSDLLMRQLARVKAKAKRENRKFSYKELKKVYTVVLVTSSIETFWDYPETFIHYSRQKFDSGLELDMLQEYIIIPLDVFCKINHNNISKLEAWLYFIGSDDPKDMIRVIEEYPEFKELYKELGGLRSDLEELIGMYDYYRQLLIDADREDVEYMVEEQKRRIEEQKQEIEEQKQEIEEQAQRLNELKGENREQVQRLNELESANQDQKQMLENKDRMLEAQKREIEELKKRLNATC